MPLVVIGLQAPVASRIAVEVLDRPLGHPMKPFRNPAKLAIDRARGRIPRSPGPSPPQTRRPPRRRHGLPNRPFSPNRCLK